MNVSYFYLFPAVFDIGDKDLFERHGLDRMHASAGCLVGIRKTRDEGIRRRDGAYRWGIFRDTEVEERYLEMFLVNSWAEHMRQHERQTQADRS